MYQKENGFLGPNMALFNAALERLGGSATVAEVHAEMERVGHVAVVPASPACQGTLADILGRALEKKV